jgi:hypothetical protein
MGATEKRLEKLESVLGAMLRGPDYCYMLQATDELDLDVVGQRLVDQGTVLPKQRVVFIVNWRWRDAHGFVPEPKPAIDLALGREPTKDDRTDAERAYGMPKYEDVCPSRQTAEEEREALKPRWLEYPPGNVPY